jgi:hypothetical protein
MKSLGLCLTTARGERTCTLETVRDLAHRAEKGGDRHRPTNQTGCVRCR